MSSDARPGLSYDFSSEKVGKWRAQNNKPSLLAVGATVDTYVQPLAFEPGTSFAYSIGIDWAGWLVERITGQTLEDYFQQNIFEPCGMTSTSFYPTEDILSRMMSMCALDNATGKLAVQKELGRFTRPMKVEEVGLFMGYVDSGWQKMSC
jgi:methyl acetate hydrolase